VATRDTAPRAAPTPPPHPPYRVGFFFFFKTGNSTRDELTTPTLFHEDGLALPCARGGASRIGSDPSIGDETRAGTPPPRPAPSPPDRDARHAHRPPREKRRDLCVTPHRTNPNRCSASRRADLPGYGRARAKGFQLVYQRWTYDRRGPNPTPLPPESAPLFKDGVKGKGRHGPGHVSHCRDHAPSKLRIALLHGLIFGIVSEDVPPIAGLFWARRYHPGRERVRAEETT